MSLRPLAQTTTYAYDQASNKIKETRPDLKFRTWDTFDNRNRVKHMTGFLGDETSYVYDFAGNMTQMTDSKGAIYGFGYDFLSRKTSATYPPDSVESGGMKHGFTTSLSTGCNIPTRAEKWTNSPTTTVIARSNLNGNWPGSRHHDRLRRGQPSDEHLHRRWHDRWFGYDNANRQISEDQTLTGQPSRHIDMPVDVDGIALRSR